MMNMTYLTRHTYLLAMVLALGCGMASSASAQNAAQNPAQNIAQEPMRESVFFSLEELDLILQASAGALELDDESDDAKDGDAGKKDGQEQPVDRGRRVLTLSGVVYQSPNDWTIWLNGERVTPRNIPEYVRGLTVHTDHIRLRWFDRAENRIVNITLRPHQQYNLDLDTILPGTR